MNKVEVCPGRKKPDFNKWMENPKENCPQVVLDTMDIEGAFKTVVLDANIFVVHDKDLKHCHVCVAESGAVVIFLKATIDKEDNLVFDGGAANTRVVGEYDE